MLTKNRVASLSSFDRLVGGKRRARRAGRALVVVERIESRLLLAATPIGSGQTIAGNISHVGQIDTYTFSAAAGSSFNISLGDASAASGMHPYVQVLNPAATRIINAGSSSLNTSVGTTYQVPPTSGGSFTVLVQDFFGTGTGAYDLELVKAPAAQAADSNGDGGVIVSGQTKAGTINRTGDLDVFTFAAAAGDSFDISLGDASAASAMHPYLQVFAPTGARIINAGSSSVNTSVGTTYRVPPGAAGTYTAIVQDFFGSAVGPYNLELDKAPATQTADSNGDGGVILSGQTKAGTINRTGDLDVFTFAVPAGNSFDISLGDASAASAMHPYLQVFAPDGTRILNTGSSGVNTSVGSTYQAPATLGGTYTAVVQDFFGSATGPYDLELAVAPASQTADSNGDGGTISNTQTKAGTISRTGDIDVFTFSCSGGDTFDLSLADSSAASGVHPYLQVFAPSGARIINNGSSGINTSVSNVYHVPSTGAGTYTIVAQDFFGTGLGGYNLQLTGNIHPLGPSIVITASGDQTAVATVPTSIKMGTFAQSNATGPFKVDINWGDGTADTFLTVANAGTIPATIHTFPAAGTDTVSETITDAKLNKSNKISFKVIVSPAKASIAGRVFNDTNGNGLVDTSELGLGLWTVYIDANSDGKLDTGDIKATTDITGKWSFSNLTAGTYVVRVVQPAGTATTKPTGGVLTLKLVAGQASTGNLFGEKGI
ncbi:MAG TPA: SdrD B-like domain-containing protein [Humisphaera sp.]|jgi:uncharacterized protein (DUF2141 family)|nr:SdrD B-like domain-containing protein [Humisphaera sp.]